MLGVLRSALGTLEIVVGNLDWMVWNLFLAFIPLALAAHLFRRESTRASRPLWWLGLAAFVVFLPNAPYVLTDLIHLNEDVPATPGIWGAALLLIPSYLVFCGLGFGAYVTSLIWLTRMLHRRGWGVFSVFAVEVSLHLVSAAGVYVGRFVRFNSWDIITRPQHVAYTTVSLFDQLGPLGFTAIFFVATCALYWPAKHLTIAMVAYVRSGGIWRSRHLADQYL